MNLDDLHGRLTITVPEAGEVLGIGRAAAYAAADSGDIPTLRVGRRLIVPVARLRAMLGETEPVGEGVPMVMDSQELRSLIETAELLETLSGRILDSLRAAERAQGGA